MLFVSPGQLALRNVMALMELIQLVSKWLPLIKTALGTEWRKVEQEVKPALAKRSDGQDSKLGILFVKNNKRLKSTRRAHCY